jgi:hypothetical protein
LLFLVTSSSVAVITAPFSPGHQPGVIGPETPIDPQSRRVHRSGCGQPVSAPLQRRSSAVLNCWHRDGDLPEPEMARFMDVHGGSPEWRRCGRFSDRGNAGLV